MCISKDYWIFRVVCACVFVCFCECGGVGVGASKFENIADDSSVFCFLRFNFLVSFTALFIV